jgi:molecular chaperone DnaK (HSP70)
MARAFAYLFISICALFSSSTLASVLAIDYGTDWSKASIVKPGIPFDVVLNKDSKRKIQSSIGWKRDERLFASEAFNIVSSHFFHFSMSALLNPSFRPHATQATPSHSLNTYKDVSFPPLQLSPNTVEYLLPPTFSQVPNGTLLSSDGQMGQNGPWKS